MDRIDCMKSFVRAIEINSFSAVAREQQTTQSKISKQIAALEKHLGVQLLTRSTTNLKLTEEGKKYYKYCQQILEAIAEAEANLTEKERPTGILHIGCPVLFGQMQIVPRLQSFMNRFPDIKIDLMMTDHFVDIVESGLDLIIRIGNHGDKDLISHQIGVTRRVTIATKKYFQNAGNPITPDDLTKHNCIVYTNLTTVNEWHFQGSEGATRVTVEGRFQTNSSVAGRCYQD